MPKTSSHKSRERLRRAAGFHNAGELARAERIYREVLADDPEHPDALHLLGLIAAEAGQPDVACALIGQAIRLHGPHPSYCRNLGQIFLETGRIPQAIACYAQALESAPSDPLSWARMGRALLAAGHTVEARDALEQAVRLDPRAAAAHLDLGHAYERLHRWKDAADSYIRALQHAPKLAEAHFRLANIHHLHGRYADAALGYRQALLVAPDHAEAAFHLGVTCLLLNEPDQAEAAYRHALRYRPNHARAHNNLGTLLQSTGRRSDAMDSYARAIEADPAYAEPHYNLGLAFQDEDRLEEALPAYETALRLAPGHAQAGNNRGNVLLALGRPHDALASYQAAATADPDHAEAHWNIALAQLLLGDYEAGWKGYEWRFRQRDSQVRAFEQPLWDGAPLQGLRILIHAEQGLGDTIQFIRYAPLVKAVGGRVILECQPALAGLLASVEGLDRIVPRGEPLPDFDCHAPLLSLPRIFGSTLATIPASVPYLAPPPDRLERWERELPTARRRIGLVWAGNPRHKNDRNRSLPVESLRALAGLPGAALVSLQKDQPLPPGLDFLDLGPHLADFADTAAVIAQLDLVIAVDTSVAHLTGAMGKPAWTLLPFAPDWRWMLDRPDSPWYPSMRLFRQPARGDWESVLDAVRSALLES
ncbi:MAG: tetratricopeptide repeat protein [Bryobacteraceae bacterium]